MFERKIVGMAPPIRLGILRVIIVATALMNVLWEDYPSFAEAPFSWYRPEGFMMFIPWSWMQNLMTSAFHLTVFKWTLVTFLTLALVGYMTRLSLFFALVLYFIFLGSVRAYAWFFHFGLASFYLMFFLLMLPCADGFSLDHRLRKNERTHHLDERPSEVIGWSVFLLRAVLALCYFQAGYAKVHNTGLAWVEPWNLKHFVVGDSLTVMHFDFDWGLFLMHWPDGIWQVLAIGALFSELLYPAVLFSWHLRMVYPLIGIFLHGSILLLHNIFFPDLILLQAIFYDWERIQERRTWPGYVPVPTRSALL